MRKSILSMLSAAVLTSATALAQPITSPGPTSPPAPPPTFSDYSPGINGPGNGMQLELSVFQVGGIYSGVFNATTGIFGAGSFTSSASLPSGLLYPQPLVSVGYQWDQNALLLGIGFNASSLSSFTGLGGGNNTTLVFGISPTYRRYFSPLRTGQFSAFAEGSVAFLIEAPNGASSIFGLGFDGGAGGEWLFVKNFALFAKATLGYSHVGLGGGENVDGVGLAGDIGLTVHM